MTEKKMKIEFPATLSDMWKYLHKESCGMLEKDFTDAWETLHVMQTEYLLKHKLPDIRTKSDAEDAVKDFMIHLLNGACPFVVSFSCLIANLRKYLASTRNPVQYEMNKILHEALLSLENEKRIQRDAASVGKRISGRTRFALCGTSDKHLACRADYERNAADVPRYSTSVRNNDPEHTKMLTPKNAENLTEHLLRAFGGWTLTSDLLSVMAEHIPEQMIITSLTDGNLSAGSDFEPNAKSALENIAPADSDDYVYSSDLAQIQMTSNETADRIWTRILKISDRTFCLYFLPNNLYGVKTSLKILGATSTINDQTNKIIAALKNELSAYVEFSAVSERVSSSINATVCSIFKVLSGRCTEKGYSPDLLVRKSNRKDLQNEKN